jgi:hypothetical protein
MTQEIQNDTIQEQKNTKENSVKENIKKKDTLKNALRENLLKRKKTSKPIDNIKK